MPFLYTNAAGRRFPKKTLTVDVYASRLEQGILTPTTKSLGFKTYLAKTPTSPFFIDEKAYLEVFRSHWESVIVELAPKYNLSVEEATRIFPKVASNVKNENPTLKDSIFADKPDPKQKALLKVDPAIIAHGKPVAHLKQDFAATFANALRRSAASKEFVPLHSAKPTVFAVTRKSIVKQSEPSNLPAAADPSAALLVSIPVTTSSPPTVAEKPTGKATMATRPTIKVNNLPAVTEDSVVSAVSDTMSPGGVDRAARKKLVLSKLREDAYPLRHEWVFWHERLDRTSSTVKTSSRSSTPECSPDSPQQKTIKAPSQDSVQDSRKVEEKFAPNPKDGGTGVQESITTKIAQLLSSQNGQFPEKLSSNGTSHRYGLPNTATSPLGAAPDKNTDAPSYEETLVPLMDVATVKKFWETTNNFDLATLKIKDTIHMFKKTVKPVWEDPRNVRGGSWTFRLNKSISTQAWVRVQLMAIGETLQEVILPGDDICGVSVSVRFNSHLVSIWNRDASNQASIDAIKAKVLEELPAELQPTATNIYYKKHSEHRGFSEAVAAKKAREETGSGN